MEHLWRIEKRDVWAFPQTNIFEEDHLYGIRIENTGRGSIEPYEGAGKKPVSFIWAQHVDQGEFIRRTKAQWLELLEAI